MSALHAKNIIHRYKSHAIVTESMYLQGFGGKKLLSWRQHDCQSGRSRIVARGNCVLMVVMGCANVSQVSAEEGQAYYRAQTEFNLPLRYYIARAMFDFRSSSAAQMDGSGNSCLNEVYPRV